MKVVVCTDKRGVFFGDCEDVTKRPIELYTARMCLYWSKAVGGVLGLADVGPDKDSRVSATAPKIFLEGVTAVMIATAQAAKAWQDAPVQGRGDE